MALMLVGKARGEGLSIKVFNRMEREMREKPQDKWRNSWKDPRGTA